jgi:NADPH-dependent curcumin reductase CurA
VDASKASRIVLAARPNGMPKQSDFGLEEFDVPNPGEDQILVHAKYLSVDPYMRGRMDDRKSYAPPVQIDGVMGGDAVAEVIESKNKDYKPGDVLLINTGWQTHFISNGKNVRKLEHGEKGAPVSTALGILGMPGFTAYGGMRVIGQTKSGETVVVAAATGPVGSLVGQMAKMAGARIVGIAGGAEKCAYVRDELEFDVALDHKSEKFEAELAEACPKGIDVYFENVGGRVWRAVSPLLNRFARVPVCGLIAQYNGISEEDKQHLAAGLMRDILSKSLTVRGFINTDFIELYQDFLKEIGEGVNTGKLKYQEDTYDGLEKAPVALVDMLQGKNKGKVVIKV